jgi:hypothetical protein
MILSGRQFVTHGAWRLALNVAKTPIDVVDMVVFHIRGQAYRDIQKLTKIDPQQVAILNRLNKSKDTYDMYQLDFLKVAQEEHYCAAWSPKSEQCSCNQVCPLSFSILSINRDQIAAKETNTLSTMNHFYHYWDGQNLGHCWGHAVFTQKLKRLALFRPREVAPFLEGSKEWVKFYSKILKNIAHDKAQIVPGFSNILEFSKHPKLLQKFANRVSQMWGSKSMSIPGFIQSSFAIPQSTKRNLHYINKIRNRLLNHQEVAVIMGRKIPLITLKSLHVNIVSRVYESNDEIIVCYEDNNLSGAENSNCARKDRFKLDGELIKSWHGPKTIVYHEDADAAKQVRSMWKLCHQICENPSLEDPLPPRQREK